jgi:hypothetical protein
MLYLADQLHVEYSELMRFPWSRRKRLVNEHVELMTVRAAKQEEAVRKARSRR